MTVTLFALVSLTLLVVSCYAAPQSEQPSNFASQLGQTQQTNPSSMMPNDYWNWRNNPLYSDYWQREMTRRQWAQRNGVPTGYYPGVTAGPDSQYTYKTYDNPEYYGYDSVFPGGTAHFIGYKTQGGKNVPSDLSQDQNLRNRPSFLNSPVTGPTFPSNPSQNFERK